MCKIQRRRWALAITNWLLLSIRGRLLSRRGRYAIQSGAATDIQRQASAVRKSAARIRTSFAPGIDFEAELEAVFHQNNGESQQIGADNDQSVDLSQAARKRCPQMKRRSPE